MKAFVFLAALIGLASALQYPMEYHYKYEGRLATGIPAIRSQVAALGIKAQVVLQMKAKTEGLVKLNNVEVGEHNDDLKCSHLRQPIPFRYSPMPQEYKKILEEPFAVSFLEEMGDVMKVPKADVEFVTNIRKSIVEMLRLEPVIANLGGIKGDKFAQRISSAQTPMAWRLEEESIFGRCESQYSLVQLPPHLAQHVKQDIRQHIKEDEQSEGSTRSKTVNLPKLKEQYYRLVRAINFDKCHDRVVLQHAGLANMTKVGHSQFKSVQSRSSVGTYILKGEPKSFRVERAIVEGDISTNPFGFKTHRIQAITNQTLVLERAQAIQTPPIRLPSALRNVKTWRYEVASAYAPPSGHPKPWVNYYSKNDKYFPTSSEYALLGLPVSPAMVQQYKKNIVELLDSVVQNLYSEPSVPSDLPSPKNTKSSIALTHLHHIARMMRAVPLPTVRQIFTEIFRQKDTVGMRKQIMLIDAAAASGAAAPVKVLLEKMKSGEITPQRTGSIFFTFPNNIVQPSVIPDIMEYVKTLDMERNPILTSTALVNFASLAERVCLNPKKFNYTVANPLFGKDVCNPSEIKSSFLPYLKQHLQQWTKPSERAILIQALANLGVPEILPILKPYIRGKQEPNPRVRSVAIYALSKRRLPSSAKTEVFDMLMEILDNVGEHPQVRHASFITLMTWHPDSAWYQRMARMTWREPSQNLAAYITFNFESMAKSTDPYLAKQSRIASFVLPLLKPFSPSLKYSFESLYSSYDHKDKVGLRAQFAYIQSLREVIPSSIYTALSMNHGDLQIPTLEAAFDSEGLSEVLYELVNSLQYPSASDSRHHHQSPKHHSSRHIRDVMEHIQSQYRSQSSEPRRKEATLFFRTYQNMYQFIPIDSEVISKVAGPDAVNLLRRLHQGVKVNVTKFFNPIDLEYFYPTEIGLPLTGLVHMPTINVGDAEVRLVTKDVQTPTLSSLMSSKKIELLFKTDYKYASKLIVKVAVPTPWNKKIVESGIENLREINLPIYGNITFSHNEEVKNLTFNISPHTSQRVHLVHGHNIPYTLIRNFVPSVQLHTEQKVIAVKKTRQPIVRIQKKLEKKYTGLDIEVKYDADVSSPISSEVLFDYARHPERLMKVIQSPTAKQYQYTVILNPRSETRNVSIAFAYLTPSSQSSGSESIPNISPEDSVREKLHKLSQLSEGSHVQAINAQVSFKGQQYRKYEALVAFTKKHPVQSQKEYRTMVALMSSPVPDYSQSPRVLCAQAEFTTPNVTDLDSLKQQLQSQMHETVRGQVYYGRSCASSKIASIEGKVKVSEGRKSQIEEELQQICNYDALNPVVELQTPAVYDKGFIDIKFEKENIPDSLMNMTYNAQNYLEGYLYPHGYYNNMYRGPESRVMVELQRPLSSRRYTFSVESPKKYSKFSEIQVPDLVTRVVPWTGLNLHYSKHTNNMILSNKMTDNCRITESNVITFDSVEFDYTPLHCWTTAAMDYKNPQDFIVHTRRVRPGKFEVHAFWPENGVSVIFNHNEAIINGHQIPQNEVRHLVKTTNGRVLGEILKYSNYYELKMIGRLTIIVKDYVELIPEFRMKNNMRGVCGDFDGDKTLDFTGPKTCLYTDKELFKFAYTIPEGDQCNTQLVNQMHGRITEFQKKCSKRPSNRQSAYLTHLYKSKSSTNCYQHVYPIKRKGPALCVTVQPVQLCSSECNRQSKKVVKEMAKCWISKNVPEEVRAAEKKGYLTHPVNQPAKFQDQIEVVTDTRCTKV